MSDRDEQFRRFVAERSAELLRLAYLLCGDRTNAEDLLQIALLRAYMRWGRIQSNPLGYVRRVLATVAVDEGRRAFRRRERTVAEPPEGLIDDDLAAVDAGDALANALRALPAGQRAAVVLRYWLDLDAAMAAELLGSTPETVRSQASRGLAKLRAASGSDRAPVPSGEESS